jgi:hypothetical protein
MQGPRPVRSVPESVLRETNPTETRQEEPMSSWYQWTSPVRNLAWVTAHYGYR